jgi:transcriptional regulator with XRE-family HTH domain
MNVNLPKRLIGKLLRKAYRDEYVAENVRTGLAYQIRALREQRGWTQKDLADRLNTQPSVVCRMEDPEYGKNTLQTLIDVANVFDVGLIAKYVSLPEMIYRSRDVSPKSLEVEGFNETQLSGNVPYKPGNYSYSNQSASTGTPSKNIHVILSVIREEKIQFKRLQTSS